MKIPLPPFIDSIGREIESAGGRLMLVGGSVRDALLGFGPGDLDFEVQGIPLQDLEMLLMAYGAVNQVGKAFGILKLTKAGETFDFSLPRKEKKTGSGHRGFSVEIDPGLSFSEAAARRDFTVNAMGYDVATKRLEDPFNGQIDLKARVLRHVGPAFIEDPLRGFRAMQLSARFGLDIDNGTAALCRKLPISELPKERIFEEFKKLLLKAEFPSRGFLAMENLGILSYFDELSALRGVEQNPYWHPEGDVWTHTLMVVDEMAAFRTGESAHDLLMMLAAVSHDLGKPSTTELKAGNWTSHGHEDAGVPLTRSLIKKLTDQKDFINPLLALVREHLRPILLHQADQKQPVSDAVIRRLSMRVCIKDLVTLARVDHFGRTTEDAKHRVFEAGDWLAKRAQALNVWEKPPKPLIEGRDLLAIGFFPGPSIGRMLKAVMDEQVEGHLKSRNDCLTWVQSQKRFKKLL
ncbi:MAG: tRNA nucleotidyltransferase (CCA-adding enzyme) [Candidatus Marinamargulisbacteria bacterium]|jgi:tRNA nucleotidyltransferase (CCA-adding enzyme)